MATSKITKNPIVTQGIIHCSNIVANQLNTLIDSDGNPTALVTAGEIPDNARDCLFQIISVGTGNDATITVHADGKALYVRSGINQSTLSVRWLCVK